MKHSERVLRLYQQKEKLTKNLHLQTIKKSLNQDIIKGTKKQNPVVYNISCKQHCTSRVENYFKEIISHDLVVQCFINTIMEITPPEKIVLSTSSKKTIQDKKQLVVGLAALKMISGQKSQPTRAKRSIAVFKLRKGSIIGCKVTLRKKALYSFLDKLSFLALPRSRLSLVHQGSNANSCFGIGISDPFIFIELEGHYDLFQSLHGIDVTFGTAIKQKGMLELLLSGLQMKV